MSLFYTIVLDLLEQQSVLSLVYLFFTLHVALCIPYSCGYREAVFFQSQSRKAEVSASPLTANHNNGAITTLLALTNIALNYFK